MSSIPECPNCNNSNIAQNPATYGEKANDNIHRGRHLLLLPVIAAWAAMEEGTRKVCKQIYSTRLTVCALLLLLSLGCKEAAPPPEKNEMPPPKTAAERESSLRNYLSEWGGKWRTFTKQFAENDFLVEVSRNENELIAVVILSTKVGGNGSTRHHVGRSTRVTVVNDQLQIDFTMDDISHSLYLQKTSQLTAELRLRDFITGRYFVQGVAHRAEEALPAPSLTNGDLIGVWTTGLIAPPGKADAVFVKNMEFRVYIRYGRTWEGATGSCTIRASTRMEIFDSTGADGVVGQFIDFDTTQLQGEYNWGEVSVDSDGHLVPTKGRPASSIKVTKRGGTRRLILVRDGREIEMTKLASSSSLNPVFEMALDYRMSEYNRLRWRESLLKKPTPPSPE